MCSNKSSEESSNNNDNVETVDEDRIEEVIVELATEMHLNQDQDEIKQLLKEEESKMNYEQVFSKNNIIRESEEQNDKMRED